MVSLDVNTSTNTTSTSTTPPTTTNEIDETTTTTAIHDETTAIHDQTTIDKYIFIASSESYVTNIKSNNNEGKSTFYLAGIIITCLSILFGAFVIKHKIMKSPETKYYALNVNEVEMTQMV